MYYSSSCFVDGNNVSRDQAVIDYIGLMRTLSANVRQVANALLTTTMCQEVKHVAVVYVTWSCFADEDDVSRGEGMVGEPPGAHGSPEADDAVL